MGQSTTIHHLEMLERGALRPSATVEGFELVRVTTADGNLNRRFYQSVGADWKWTDRLPWSELEWQTHVERESLSTYVAMFEGTEVGYVELEQQAEGSVQIAYFGLLPGCFGKGLGGAMLTAAVQKAWDLPGTRRVWVHTCTDDHEHALVNYQKRGFTIFKSVAAE